MSYIRRKPIRVEVFDAASRRRRTIEFMVQRRRIRRSVFPLLFSALPPPRIVSFRPLIKMLLPRSLLLTRQESGLPLKGSSPLLLPLSRSVSSLLLRLLVADTPFYAAMSDVHGCNISNRPPPPYILSDCAPRRSSGSTDSCSSIPPPSRPP